ncbi:hypothetical protein LN995_15440 [Pontibacter silvestris]|nr:hypothetical protein [Pontibacter silvestris]
MVSTSKIEKVERHQITIGGIIIPLSAIYEKGSYKLLYAKNLVA